MMRKLISAAETTSRYRVTIVTLDNHLASAAERARRTLQGELPGLELDFHAAADWNDPAALEACRRSILASDIVVCTMLFMEEHAEAVLPALRERRPHCDAMLGCMSAPQIVKLTRVGRLNMDGSKRGAFDFLKKLRGRKPEQTGGAAQLAMLRRIPKILRYIPGPAQDLRAYFLTLQYWLAGSDENFANLVRFLVNRYASGAYAGWKGALRAEAPIEYPDIGVYHPRLPGRVSPSARDLPSPAGKRGTVGLLLMRSYILANNTAHYDAVIAALEARGLAVVPIFASGLDARPAAEAFLFDPSGRPRIDAFVSLTGFSLVGGPAYNDCRSAAELLGRLDVPYLAAHALEFQTLEQWEGSERGLLPVENTIMVAIPELDGAVAPTVFGGRSSQGQTSRDLKAHPERVAALAERVARFVRLRQTPAAARKLAIVLFNFPPNGGAAGTAAYLGVYASLLNTLKALRRAGYDVEVPADEDALRLALLGGNAARLGSAGNVCARIPIDDHVRREPHLKEIEAQWGPAPGRSQTDGRSLFVVGETFGKVLVTLQPPFGYEGDPMRLLFERGFAPTHAFSAYYRYLREDFGADAILHFGMHGALEFMPGKQAGMSAACWPERLIGATPNVYLYAANNPAEGALAKRRSAATLVSYLTPSLAQAGLYRGLLDLKASLERYRALELEATRERDDLTTLIQTQAATLDLCPSEPAFGSAGPARVARLVGQVLELEYTLIPHGLHVIGETPGAQEREDTLTVIAETTHGLGQARALARALIGGATPDAALKAAGLTPDETTLAAIGQLGETARLLGEDHETEGLLRALDGRFIAPVVGGDLMRTPSILPTGRNLHGFDPYRIPSAYAVEDGRRQTERVLQRYRDDGHDTPETVAVVLWGADNLKSEGGPLAQALAWIGAKPRFDAYGRLCGADLIPLAELGRPRIDVVVTLSGIFRDLLPLQTRLLAEACWLAACADEPADANFVRKHALALVEERHCDLETAALRVFSNAEGAYGANVGMLIDSGAWEDEDEISNTFARRKGFAYSRKGVATEQRELLACALKTVDFAYQSLDCVELGVTSIDQYFDSLGGLGRATARAKGVSQAPVYICDQTRGEGKVRSLTEQVALETRTRVLNPKWYEGMLKYGYEGVRQIEAHVTNTMGWSATTGQVEPWVYEQITKTFVLDPAMRARLAELNPAASAKMTNRILEAHARGYWTPDADTLASLRDAGDEMEDRLEGAVAEVA